MRGIFFQDKVYVFVEGDESNALAKTEEQMHADKQIILYQGRIQGASGWWTKSDALLYGGRVHVTCPTFNTDSGKLSIDGIEFGHQATVMRSGGGGYGWVNNLSLSQITAFLNEIEQLGVDAVLDNYKKALFAQKAELEEKIKAQEAANITEGEKKDLIDRRLILQDITEVLSMLICMLYCGLTNMQYITACDEVMKMYF